VRIAFVIPWYGKDAAGGAEAECRGLVQGLQEFYPSLSVEVFTTRLKEFSADWNVEFYPEGESREDGVVIRRFGVTKPGRRVFHKVNGYFLMRQSVRDLWVNDKPRSPVPILIERYYLKKMIVSPPMFKFIRDHRDEYDFFVFIPYMFGTTVFGSEIAGSAKSIIIPCLHNERYAYMKIYRRMMESACGLFFHVKAEQELARRLYNIPERTQYLLGEMVEGSPHSGQPHRFRSKFGISGRFILYAGRKIEGKNLPLLVRYFKALKAAKIVDDDLRLVIIGRGSLDYGDQAEAGIIDLGFVAHQDKLDAMSAASIFCMPSLNESFSIVLMESWLQGVPAMVHGQCDVTREHCQVSGGGLWFEDQNSFNEGVLRILTSQVAAQSMGKSGCEYVVANFGRRKIVDRFVSVLERIKSAL
jgi:glycosyltransferase involved in cell wall biosynthesis